MRSFNCLAALALTLIACTEPTRPKALSNPGRMSVSSVAAPAASFAYVANAGKVGISDPRSVSVIETAGNTVAATVPVGNHPWGVAITPDGEFTYVTNEFSNSVSVIRIANNEVVATVPVGKGPYGIAITPDGKFAYVGIRLDSTVDVIETATNTVVDTVPVGLGPIGVAITPDGAFAYVAIESGYPVDLAVIDIASNTVVATLSEPRLDATGVAITPDGRWAYVTSFGDGSVFVIPTATNKVVTTIPVGQQPFFVAFTPDGSFAYVTNFWSNSVSVIETSTNTVVRTIPVPGGPAGVATPRAIPVDIDIKPGSDVNSVNCNNDDQLIPVAILTTRDFDATTVDHTTVVFEGATEFHRYRKTQARRRHEEDVDGDGDTDLVLHFRFGDTGLSCGAVHGTLTGRTFNGTAIIGTDAIRTVGF